MGRGREVEARIDALGEIGQIMRAMKNLSYMETRKLSRSLDSQRRVVEGIDVAARDFLDHFPELQVEIASGGPLCVAIGAERGFCAGFNEAILESLDERLGRGESAPVRLIAVGSKLVSALEGDPRVIAGIAGSTAAEEVPAVLNQLTRTLAQTTEQTAASLTVLHWDAPTGRVASVPLLPPFRSHGTGQRPARPYPPRLNLPPEQFFARLTDHYLLAALHEILFSSLMAEHEQRVRHLEGALQRVDTRVHDLSLRRSMLRQEEITEEIELILLHLAPPRRVS